MPNSPVAVSTFSEIRIYFSSRDSAPPGSGTWTVLQTYFDGFTPTLLSSASGFSSGALTSDPVTENRGALFGITPGTGTVVPSYIGNGSPDSIHAITVTGFTGKPNTTYTFWSTSTGAFSFGGAKYQVVVDDSSFSNPVRVIKSPDGTSPWTVQDPTNGPPASADSSATALQRIDNYIFILTATNLTDNTFRIYPFNMATGLWETPSTVLNVSNFQQMGGRGSSSIWSNGVIKFPNGDFAVFYWTSDGAFCSLLTGGLAGSWGAPITLPGTQMEVTVIDPSLTFTHVVTSEDDGTLNYSTLDQAGTLVSTIATIPPAVSPLDGVGKPSIQDGMIFIPRDDLADQKNSVWVATIPVTTFVGGKEFLPTPPGEQNQPSGASVNSGGSGYANGDTFFINGGISPCYAVVTGQTGGSVDTFDISIGGVIGWGGGGYSIGTNIPTTNSGIQPGVGTGLTVDIPAVGNPHPSCAYMMFPNGYLLSTPPPPDVILTFNLHGATTPPSALLTINPPTSGPPGPIINPTQCIEQDGTTSGGGVGPPLPPLPPPIPPGVTSPVITTLTVPGGTVGFFYPAFAFSASGTGPITWHATGLPPSLGLSINGFLFGNVVGPAGTFSFQVTATNSSGTSAPVTFSITIGAFGVAPSITNVSPLPNANVGTPYAITFTANGTAPITWSALIPINTFFDPVTAIFSFTPTAVGVINFQVRATNGAGDTGLLPFSITVDPPAIPIPPIIPTPPGG